MEEENREKNILVMTKRSVGRKRKRKRRNSTSDDNNDVKRWSDLPNELLESIKKRLFYIDQCKFSEVCKSWSTSIEEEEEERTLLDVPPLQQTPWLLVFDEPDSCKLVDSMFKKTYTVDTKAIKKKMNISSFVKVKFHESKYGWLLFSSYQNHTPTSTTNSLFFYCPFYNEKNNFIQLPILNVHYIIVAAFTSNPLDDNNCTVVTLSPALIRAPNAIVVNTYRRGQSSWSSRVFNTEFPYFDVTCWTYSEGMFYYIADSGRVGAFDLVREDWTVFPSPPLTPTVLSNTSGGPIYMVKSNQELFLIVKKMRFNTKNWRWSCSRRHICRLDLLSMIWEDLSSIGDDRVLFIGNGYNCVLNSSVLKLNGKREGISDTIYHCSDQELKYCTVHDFTTTNDSSRKQPWSRHYVPIATKQCIVMLIDPP